MKSEQTGFAHAFLIIGLIVTLVGALGFIFWQNYIEKDSTRSTSNSNNTQPVDSSDPCEGQEGIAAGTNTFCSPQVGIKLQLPSIFLSKLNKTTNYEVFKGGLDPSTKISAGSSNIVYSAAITGNDDFTFTIANEPLRSGYAGVGHGLQETYYDVETGLLSNTKFPTRTYDSATDSYKTSGEFSIAATVPSFMADNVKVYRGTVGDAGTTIRTYFMVINENIVKIELRHVGYMGPTENDPSTVDSEQIFNELDAGVKDIEVLN